jgi:general secretion pathway protein A
MYNAAFGLTKNPFNMTPDPAFLYLTAQHREALVALTYAILHRKGFAVLTGEAGTGKTTLLARVLQHIPATRLQFSLVLNPTLTRSEFLELAMLDFGFKNVPTSKAQRLWKLQELLLDAEHKGKTSVLIVDEAHKLSPEVLEEIRLLGNFEHAEHKLLQIVLAGQPELDQNLNRGDLRQLKQRIAMRLRLEPLSTTEVVEYVRHRWTVAGGNQVPFSAAALHAVAASSNRIPRLINSLCDSSLTMAFADGAREVSVQHVEMAAKDLGLMDTVAAVAAEPPPAVLLPPVAALQVPEPAAAAERAAAPAEPVEPALPAMNGSTNGNGSTSRWTRWMRKLEWPMGSSA